MSALNVDYDRKTDTITLIASAVEEEWTAVCEQFDHDVHRLKDVSGAEADSASGGWTGLFLCLDDANQAFFYLVREDRHLYRQRRKSFYQKLGRH